MWYFTPISPTNDIAPVTSAARASCSRRTSTRRRSPTESTICKGGKRARATLNADFTHASFKPGGGPRPNCRETYTPKTPETGCRTPRARRQGGDTNQCRKQSCKSIPPMYAPGECNAKKPSIAPYWAGGSPTPNSMNTPRYTIRALRVPCLLSRSGTKDGLSDPAGTILPHTNGSCPAKPGGPAALRHVPDRPQLKGNLAAPPPVVLRCATTGYHRTNCPASLGPPGLSRETWLTGFAPSWRRGPLSPSTDPVDLGRTPSCETEQASRRENRTKCSAL